jgi:hypothetical protein
MKEAALADCFPHVSCFSYSSTLKMEAVTFLRNVGITWRYIPDKITVQNPNVFVVVKGNSLHLINGNLVISHQNY